VKYFTKVKISLIALMKMLSHSHSGDELEVMGLLQGRVCDNTFIVSDVFGLPVEGTETRVCAGNDANVYINDYVENMESVRRKEN
jgi:COP9 signalosome complex subunit 5